MHACAACRNIIGLHGAVKTKKQSNPKASRPHDLQLYRNERSSYVHSLNLAGSEHVYTSALRLWWVRPTTHLSTLEGWKAELASLAGAAVSSKQISFNSLLNSRIVMSDSRNEAGNVFQTLGPATWKALSRKPVWVMRGTTHVETSDERSRRRSTSETSWTSSEALNHAATCVYTSRANLNWIRRFTDSQCMEPLQDWRDVWSDLLAPDTSTSYGVMLCLIGRTEFSTDYALRWRRTFPIMHLTNTCSWTGDHFVSKLSATGQQTRPTQPFFLPGSVNEYWSM